MYKRIQLCIIIVSIFLMWHISYSQTVDEFIAKAEKFHESGDLEAAANVIEQALLQFPENSSVHSYMGFYRGIQAGQTQNYMEAGRLIGVSYELMDKAVALDPENPIARFHRGLMGIKVPPFMGKLDDGISDLEMLVAMQGKAPDRIPVELAAQALDFLGQGYLKKQENEKAIAAWERVVVLAPGTEFAKNAEKKIAELTQSEQTAAKPEKKYSGADVKKLEVAVADETSAAKLTELGKAYNDTGQHEKAAKVLRKAINQDSTVIDAYKYLLEALGELAKKGYDERIYSDTDYRSKQAFEVSAVADRAVTIAPEDDELRLIRGSIGVSMPFFVGKLEQGIADLTKITEGDAPEEIKAEALYWLGYAHQKKATTYWIKVISDYSKTNASKYAFQSMRPAVKHFDPSQYNSPYLAIDFVLGFRDELPPQTAVWIEDKDGEFIKTIYVSGFSGFAKEKQVNLSDWADASNFADADVVTTASIDVGHHIYVWDLKDQHGKTVQPGEYVVNIEVAYWPSMEYQSVSANVKIGKKDSRVVIKEDNLIPYLEVKYVN